jgi:hypothetical protein
MPMQCEGGYHALANDGQCFLPCESVEAPMSQWVRIDKTHSEQNGSALPPRAALKRTLLNFAFGPRSCEKGVISAPCPELRRHSRAERNFPGIHSASRP